MVVFVGHNLYIKVGLTKSLQAVHFRSYSTYSASPNAASVQRLNKELDRVKFRLQRVRRNHSCHLLPFMVFTELIVVVRMLLLFVSCKTNWTTSACTKRLQMMRWIGADSWVLDNIAIFSLFSFSNGFLALLFIALRYLLSRFKNSLAVISALLLAIQEQ